MPGRDWAGPHTRLAVLTGMSPIRFPFGPQWPDLRARTKQVASKQTAAEAPRISQSYQSSREKLSPY